MNIVAIDDEKLALEALGAAIVKAEPDANFEAFRHPEDLFDYMKNNKPDVCFVDIEMREMGGIDVAKKIKSISSNTNIIFATGYGDYRGDAFDLHASGYIMKPITADKIRTELDNLRFPIEHKKTNRVRFKTFGNFEVYIDGKPANFKYDKTKEMLAFMVERDGALCTNGEIMATLWEDDNNHDSYLRNIRMDLMTILELNGLDDILIKQRGKMGIVKEKVDCDYYDYLAGKDEAINAYQGEFMTQYSWGEYTSFGI